MEIKLHQSDRIRTSTQQGNIFVDVYGCDWEVGVGVAACTALFYIEVRKKDNMLKMFVLDKKSSKKDIDFGHWEDAEVVYSCNEITVE